MTDSDQQKPSDPQEPASAALGAKLPGAKLPGAKLHGTRPHGTRLTQDGKVLASKDPANKDLANKDLASKALVNKDRAQHDLDADALMALEQARKLEPGPERAEAMKRAGILRYAADLRGLFFPKRGRPRKT